MNFGRWWRFNAVGILGAGVQLAVLALLVRLGVNYLAATVVAVEIAVLHNYSWHRRWTWAGRRGSLWRFHLANGAVSIASNVILMRVFVGVLSFNPVVANLAAIAITCVVNFVLGDRWVFSTNRT